MLKVKGVRDVDPDGRLFEISSEGSTAAEAEIALVARFASRLLRENDLSGEFRVVGPGVLELRLEPAARTFFHDGIVFAALDAVNDPVKNPTLTRFSMDVPDDDGEVSFGE